MKHLACVLGLWFLAAPLALAQGQPQPGPRPGQPRSPFAPPVPVIPTPSFNPALGGFAKTPVEVWWWLDPYWTWYYPWFNAVTGNGLPFPLVTSGGYPIWFPYAVPYAVPYGVPYGMPVPTPMPRAAAAPKPAEDRPGPPKDDLDARARMNNEIRAGNGYLAMGEVPRALRSYEAAAIHMPLDPMPLFHQGQALLALGQANRAVVVIQRGLKWQPEWPASEFAPRSLYGSRTAAFERHLAALADQVDKNPNDASLLFLLGYQLWFDGRREQAVPLLRRAAALSVDTEHLKGFLQK